MDLRQKIDENNQLDYCRNVHQLNVEHFLLCNYSLNRRLNVHKFRQNYMVVLNMDLIKFIFNVLKKNIDEI